MRPLDKKLMRDLASMKGQMIAVGMVMVCGLAVMIMARSLILSLETTRNEYYTEHRLADVFCELTRAPNSLRDQIGEISGVMTVETRIQGGLVLDIPGMAKPADGLVLSLPDDREQKLHLLYLRTGRLPEKFSTNEVVVNESFAKAHGFQPGDELEATIYGSRENLRIVGIALSPEFVIETRSGDIVPDAKGYGIFWMNERELANAFDLEGAFNSVLLDLGPGASVDAVLEDLDRILEPYGGRVAYSRENHPRARQVDDEIAGLRAFSVAFPIIFLSIAAFMTSAALTRVVRLQREQIAQLKAFGYSSFQVGVHYLKFALVVVLGSTAVGGVVGFILGTLVVMLYQYFFHFPELYFHPDTRAILLAFVAAGFASCIGVMGAVRMAVSLPPAEAMRPEPPADFKPTILERLGIHKLVSPASRMTLRQLERKPWQAFFTAVGLSLAAAIPIVPGAMRDGISYLMDFQWTQAQRQDASLTLIEPGSASAISAIQHLPGVIDIQPFRAVSTRMRHGHIDHRVGVIGMPRNASLNRLLDAEGRTAELPISGMLLSAQLAVMLDVKPGDEIEVEVQEGRRPTLRTTVAGTITDFAGVGAYMEIEALRKLMGEGGTINGAHVKVDQKYWDDFVSEVKDSPRIASIITTATSRESFDETVGQMMDTMQYIYFLFAVIVAFGVVYNSARIALSERSRDLATLRVVGFTKREVAGVMIGELALLTIIAIPFGLLIGAELSRALVESFATETIRIPLVLKPKTFAVATLIVFVSSVVSFAVVGRRIKNLDLIGVLKSRE